MLSLLTANDFYGRCNHCAKALQLQKQSVSAVCALERWSHVGGKSPEAWQWCQIRASQKDIQFCCEKDVVDFSFLQGDSLDQNLCIIGQFIAQKYNVV